MHTPSEMEALRNGSIKPPCLLKKALKGHVSLENMWGNVALLGCPRKLVNEMVSKWVITYTYQWNLLGVLT